MVIHINKIFFFFVLLVFFFFASQQAFAQTQQIVGATASTTVQNTFTLSQTGTPNVGIAVVIADLVLPNTAVITLTPAGVVSTSSSGDAQTIIVDNTGQAPGTFQVTNAAPNTTINISFVNINNLTCALCTPGNPDIVLGSFTTDVGFAPSTDALGDLTVNFGFTLTSNPGPPQYEDGTYQGSFDVTFSY